MTIQDDVVKWKKRLKRKGPFYLVKTEQFDKSFTRSDDVFVEKRGTRYYLIWNDGYKTKYGTLEDHMWTRYGIGTICVLNGETRFDLWNGSTINDEIFHAMVKVRNEVSDLPTFDLDELKNLQH